MRKVYNFTPTEGLHPFEPRDPKFPNDGYIASRKFIMIELDRGEYLDFYLRPASKGCYIFAYLDELSLIEDMRDDKVEMLKLMSSSEVMSSFVKDTFSGKAKGVRLFKFLDFTEEASKEQVFCLGLHLDMSLTPAIFKIGSKEEDIVSGAINRLIEVAVEYYKFYDKYITVPKNLPWIRKSPLRRLGSMMKNMYDHQNHPPFVVQIDKFPPILQSHLGDEGCLFLTETGIAYKINTSVPGKELGAGGGFVIGEKTFYDDNAGKNYAFWVNVTPCGSRWEISVDMDDFKEQLWPVFDSYYLKGKKLPVIFYNVIPSLVTMWFDSHGGAKGKALEDCLDGDISILVPIFKPSLVSKYKMDNGRLVLKTPIHIDFKAKDWGNLVPVTEIVYQGVLIMDEIFHFESRAKKIMRGRWLNIGTDLLKVVSKILRFT